jgi:hypothetical protein
MLTFLQGWRPLHPVKMLAAVTYLLHPRLLHGLVHNATDLVLVLVEVQLQEVCQSGIFRHFKLDLGKPGSSILVMQQDAVGLHPESGCWEPLLLRGSTAQASDCSKPHLPALWAPKRSQSSPRISQTFFGKRVLVDIKELE